MALSLTGKNIAILAANGFDENQMTEIQRALIKAGAIMKTVAPEQGVVNGWQGESWGHYFPVDASIGEALGSDFDMLVLPGGSRAVEKLKSNPHTRRIVSHFLEAGKPMAAIGSGVALLALSERISGRRIAAPLDLQPELMAAGAVISEEPMEICGNVMTSNGDEFALWAKQALEFFGEADLLKAAA